MIRTFVFICLFSLSAPAGAPSWHIMEEKPYRIVASDKRPIPAHQDNDNGETARKDGAKGSEERPDVDSLPDSEDTTIVAPKNQRPPFKEFTPTEKIEADHAVDFPADI